MTTTSSGTANTKTQDILNNFDQLPSAGFVRLPVVCALLSCSPASAWRMVRDKRIPAPVKLSPRVTGWPVGPLRAALVAKAAE